MNRLDEPVLMAVPKPMRTEFGIHQRLESCVQYTRMKYSFTYPEWCDMEGSFRCRVCRCRLYTTLQSIINAKLGQHRFWHCHENGLIKTIQMIPHNLYVSFKLASLYCGLRLILVYPNP